MKKKYKLLLIIIILLYPFYKGIRELFWVKHDSYKIGNDIEIKLRMDTDISGFQDHDTDKTITITNNETKISTQVSYVSLEFALYFYLDTINSNKVLRIADRFSGQNIYDYSALKLIGEEDCFKEYGGCGGFDTIGLAKLGHPYLTYDHSGFHK